MSTVHMLRGTVRVLRTSIDVTTSNSNTVWILHIEAHSKLGHKATRSEMRPISRVDVIHYINFIRSDSFRTLALIFCESVKAD